MGQLIARYRTWWNRAVLTKRGVVVTSAACGLAFAVAVSVGRGWPVPPQVHDEMSYLLGADTFAHGRLSNPTPPLWEHFETFHELMRPAYASKYLPAPALFLAAGQLLTGYPIVGVWISSALMCAAIAWMLLGWVRPRWALWGTLTTLFLIVAVPPNGYWIASYWGGTVAALGGALAVGGARRIVRDSTAGSAALFALGLGLLVLSRPFEGGLVAIPPVVSVAWWLARRHEVTWRRKVRCVLVPGAVVLGAAGAFLLAVNYRVTGSAYRLPYVEYDGQYSLVPTFRLTAAPNDSLAYRNGEMEAFYQQKRDEAMHANSADGVVRDTVERFRQITDFLAPGIVGLLIVLAALSFPFAGFRIAVAGVALVLLGSLAVTWYLPHYIAPLLGPWALLLTEGARRLHLLAARRYRVGAALVRVMFLLAMLPSCGTLVRVWQKRADSRELWYVQRHAIASSLTAGGGRHLVLVSYGPSHAPEQEWVYNPANFEESPVLWARSLSAEKDAALLAYFRDRVAWRVAVDSMRGPFHLIRTRP